MILFSLYIIVSATLLVQSLHSARWNSIKVVSNPVEGYQQRAFPQSKALFIENSHKNRFKSQKNEITPQLIEIKKLLAKLLHNVNRSGKEQKRETESMAGRSGPSARAVVKDKWGKWTDWSSCSVSCGKGREIRWRHCLRSCNGVETEMEEKSCQLPACGGKLFGLIKL